MTLKDKLDKFREAWGGVRVTQYEDKLVYSVTPSMSRRAATRANNLIEILDLDLVAIPNNRYPEDSFIVQLKK